MGRQQPDFDEELKRLQRRVPPWARHMIKSVKQPGAVWMRIPLAIALMIGGLLGFLPVLGFWMLPLGTVLLAIDLPWLRGPFGRLLAFINQKVEPRTG
jgi:hypothetical protein